LKPFLKFLWRAIIPGLWLFSVIEAFRGGFHPGLVTYSPPPGQSYPYPWTGVILTIIVTAIESVLLYVILRPDRFAWSLPRVGIAFVVFFLLSILVFYTFATDQPGYAYVPSEYTLLVTILLFVLLIITAMIVLMKSLTTRMQAK
jgi:H+/Cl- antiporter ClcA